MNAKRITLLGLFTTIALTIFMVEAALPTLVPIPGVKLGLANVVTLFLLTKYNTKDAATVLVARVVLASIFSGQMISFVYSACGGFLCLIVMALISRFLGKRYVYITSIFGAIAHNTGQILAAFFILRMGGIFAYIPFLMISGIITGLFTGLVCYFTLKALQKNRFNL